MKRPSDLNNHNPLGRKTCSWSHESLSAVRASLERHLDRQNSLPVPPEDLIGEVLLRLLACDMHQIRDPAAYARQILKNLVRDKIRQIQRTQRVLEILASSSAAGTSPDGTSPDGAAFEDGEFLRHLLNGTQLTRTQREIVRMIYFEGLSISEIARSLEKNPGTIHRHHHRAIGKLSAYASRLELEHGCTG